MILSNVVSRNRGSEIYFLNSKVRDEVLCPEVILMGRVIRRIFLHLYSIHASGDTCVDFILLYIIKKISCCEFISPGQVYLANQRRMFQVVIQLTKNAVTLDRGARICVVHFSRWSVTSLNGTALLVLSSPTDVLLTSRAAKYTTANTHFLAFSVVFFF